MFTNTPESLGKLGCFTLGLLGLAAALALLWTALERIAR